jgi:hypothetical protein
MKLSFLLAISLFVLSLPIAAVAAPATQSSATQPSQRPSSDFIGVWTGNWDNSLPVRLTISPTRGRRLAVLFETQISEDQPPTQRRLRPTPTGNVLNMGRGPVKLTLSDTDPDSAVAEWQANIGAGIVMRKATLRRISRKVVAITDDNAESPSTMPIILDIQATIDGCDVVNITQTKAIWIHRNYNPATDVKINGIAWDVSANPIFANIDLSGADMDRAKVLSRSGRDTVVLENTDDGVEVFFNDAPSGAAPYEIKIGFDGKSPAATQPAAFKAGDTIDLDISANIDGRDILTIDADGAHWRHFEARWPTDVVVNDSQWNVRGLPDLGDIGLAEADLSSAKVVGSSGRGLVAMEKTDHGIAVYFDDGLPGAAPYEIKIRFRKED